MLISDSSATIEPFQPNHSPPCSRSPLKDGDRELARRLTLRIGDTAGDDYQPTHITVSHVRDKRMS